MVALSSTIFSLSPFSLTETLSRGTTATTENVAPSGFQHLVQPQAWLWATWLPIFTFTGFSAQLHTRVPPVKLEEPCFTPFARDGWIVSAIAFLPGGPPARTGRAVVLDFLRGEARASPGAVVKRELEAAKP